MAYSPKVCPICGDTFIPKSPKQKYCKKGIELTCIVCGDKYIGYCQPDNVSVCSNPECKRKAPSASLVNKKYVCRVCGKEFTPSSSRQRDCNRPITRICVVCGKEFEAKCSMNDVSCTCSKACLNKYTSEQQVKGYANERRICELCGKEFTPVNNTQKICTDNHYRKCKVCGKEFLLDTSGNSREWAVTCSKTCSAILANSNVSDADRESMIAKMRKRRHSECPEKLEEYNKFLQSPKNYMEDNFRDTKVTIFALADRFGIHPTTMGNHINTNGLQNYIDYNISTMEDEVYSFILNYLNPEDIVRNDRNTIKPKEIDIFIPKFNFGIECNPTSSHNSSVPMYDSGTPMSPQYHRVKTDLCKAKGIFLLHLFGYDWTHRKNIMKSMILNVLGIHSRTIYARKCKIREVPSNDCREFLNDNHRQGNVFSPIRLGLYYQDELVSVMTFSNIRNIFRNYVDDGDKYELVRFCSKLNTSVVGGASKLLKYFIEMYDPILIQSYSDRARTRGNLYSTLGFNEIRQSEPGYVWVESKSGMAYSRVNAQKHNIKRFLKDDYIDLSQTEKQIMESHRYLQVFDSGTILWEWRRAE